MAWTDQEKDKLEELVLKGLNRRQIAEKMGKSKNAIIGRCFRMGYKVLSKEKSGPKKLKGGLTLKSDIRVLAEIKKHTDGYGWGLEFEEITEFTGYGAIIIINALKRLISTGHVRSCKSNVADHLFYNDASVRQIGV